MVRLWGDIVSLIGILILFVLGFFIGFASRMFYVIMTDRLDMKKLQRGKNVKYISPKSNELPELDQEQESHGDSEERKAG